MNHRDETQTDCFIALGDAFLLVVAATCSKVLERVQAGLGGGTRPADHAGEETA
jgi:hypothetical protein